MAEETGGLTPGQLANNGMTVQGLQKLLTGSETNLDVLTKVVADLEESGAWQAFTFHDWPGQVFRWNPAEFRKFIEAPRPQGCGTPLRIAEHLLRDTPAWGTFLRLTRGTPGGTPDGEPHNPSGANQWINRNNITDEAHADGGPPTLRVRDYARESKQGDSVGYCLRRLGKSRPDLLEKVRAGDLSAHAAMVEAGFKERQITIPVDPAKAARRLVRHFSRKQFNALVEETLRLYGEQA